MTKAVRISLRSLLVAVILGIAVVAVCVTAKADGPICIPLQPCPFTIK